MQSLEMVGVFEIECHLVEEEDNVRILGRMLAKLQRVPLALVLRVAEVGRCS
jgi:hypothetical protein